MSDATKLIGPAISAGRWLFKRLTPHLRAARWMRKQLHRSGFRVSLRQLRLCLTDGFVLNALSTAERPMLMEAELRLAAVELTNVKGAHISDAPRLLNLARRAYLGTSEQSTAIAISNTDIRAAITDLRDELVGTAPRASRSFEQALLLVTPALANRAKDLQARLGSVMDQVIDAIVSNPDRSAVLHDWTIAAPGWLPADGDLFGYLGEFAADMEENGTALVWFNLALKQAATPRAYWKARRLWVSEPADRTDANAASFLGDVAEHPLIRAILPVNDFSDRLRFIDDWHPTSDTQEAIKFALVSQFARDIGDLDLAISKGRDAWRGYSYVSAGLNAVDSLIRRSVAADHRAHSRDLEDALELAIEIRNARRNWHTASGRAVGLAMNAQMLLMNPERAWELSQAAPVGEATVSESVHADVRETAIILMAERGSVEEALKLIDDSYSVASVRQVQAREAELMLDDASANRLWAEAIEATEDLDKKASLCFRLAFKGVLHPWARDDLPTMNADIAEEIQLVAGLFAGDKAVEQRVREGSATNARLAHASVAYFDKVGRFADAAFVAERAAETWNDADDWLRAAQAQLALGRTEKCIANATKALLVGGSKWGDQFRAHSIIIEAASRVEDWVTAQVSAESMLALEPDSESAHWALVMILHFSGSTEKAFSAWQGVDPELVPRTPTEASVWLSLFRVYGSEMASMSAAAEIGRRFADNEQVRNLAVGAIMMAPMGDSAPSVDAQLLLQQYEKDYPDSHGFVKFELDPDDPSSILQTLDEILGGRPELGELQQQLSVGTLPVGLAARASGKFYAESLIVSQAPRFAGPLKGADEQGFIADSANGLVLIDTSALLTLSSLPIESANALAGQFAGLVTTSQQLLDANASRESLSRMGGGQFIPSNGETAPRFEPADPDQQLRFSESAQKLVDWFKRTDRRSNRDQDSVVAKQIPDLTGSWSSALDLATKEGFAFWCDDAATRKLALEVGVKTFGTPSVSAHLRLQESVRTEMVDTTDASLIQLRVVGVTFREISYELAAQLDGNLPLGIASAIRFGGPTDAELKMNLAIRSMAAVASSRPDAAEAWAFVGADYVAGIESGDAARTNQSIWLRRLLAQPWISSDILPFIVAGVRASATDGWRTVFEPALRGHFRALVAQSDYSTAADFLLATVANLPEEDHRIAVSIILER